MAKFSGKEMIEDGKGNLIPLYRKRKSEENQPRSNLPADPEMKRRIRELLREQLGDPKSRRMIGQPGSSNSARELFAKAEAPKNGSLAHGDMTDNEPVGKPALVDTPSTQLADVIDLDSSSDTLNPARELFVEAEASKDGSLAHRDMTDNEPAERAALVDIPSTQLADVIDLETSSDTLNHAREHFVEAEAPNDGPLANEDSMENEPNANPDPQSAQLTEVIDLCSSPDYLSSPVEFFNVSNNINSDQVEKKKKEQPAKHLLLTHSSANRSEIIKENGSQIMADDKTGTNRLQELQEVQTTEVKEPHIKKISASGATSSPTESSVNKTADELPVVQGFSHPQTSKGAREIGACKKVRSNPLMNTNQPIIQNEDESFNIQMETDSPTSTCDVTISKQQYTDGSTQ